MWSPVKAVCMFDQGLPWQVIERDRVFGSLLRKARLDSEENRLNMRLEALSQCSLFLRVVSSLAETVTCCAKDSYLLRVD